MEGERSSVGSQGRRKKSARQEARKAIVGPGLMFPSSSLCFPRRLHPPWGEDRMTDGASGTTQQLKMGGEKATGQQYGAPRAPAREKHHPRQGGRATSKTGSSDSLTTDSTSTIDRPPRAHSRIIHSSSSVDEDWKRLWPLLARYCDTFMRRRRPETAWVQLSLA